jgi:hypothetical protein
VSTTPESKVLGGFSGFGSPTLEVRKLPEKQGFSCVSATSSLTGLLIFKNIAPSNVPATPAGQWHRLRIACFGKHLRIELNGSVVIDKVVSEEKLQGHIGLQLFPPATVEFRNIRLRPLDSQGLPLRAQKPKTPEPAASGTK